MENFFSFDGRVRRVTFWVNLIAMSILNFVITAMFVETWIDWNTGEIETSINSPVLYYILILIIAVRNLSIAVRRFQDMEKGKEWALLLAPALLSGFFPGALGGFMLVIVSIAGLIYLGYAGFVPGDEGENEFGPAPPEGQYI